jgi:hypothetical protein
MCKKWMSGRSGDLRAGIGTVIDQPITRRINVEPSKTIPCELNLDRNKVGHGSN